ncbi:MAG: YkgJ family cysteine cluster protein [Candidatus Scalindua sp.]
MNNSKSGKNIHKKRKPPWYNGGLRFECQRCGNCCRGEPGTVWINKWEIKDTSALLGISPNQFAEENLRIINGRISLLEHDNGDCIMYDNGCKIYETRPLQCKTFPFWKSNLRNRAEWKEQGKTCPGIGKGKLHTVEEIESRLGPELSDL